MVVSDQWVCVSCRSVNAHGTDACASCRHRRGPTDVDFSGLGLGSPTDPEAADLAAWLNLSPKRRDAMDPTSTAAWLNVSREEQEELAVGVWLMLTFLAAPASPNRDSEEMWVAVATLQGVANGSKSWSLRRVIALLRELGPERMPDVFLRVAGIPRGDSPAHAVINALPRADRDAAAAAVFATTRGVLGKLPENDRRRFGAALLTAAGGMVNADSGSQAMPRDRKVIRAANILTAIGIDDVDKDWLSVNGY